MALITEHWATVLLSMSYDEIRHLPASSFKFVLAAIIRGLEKKKEKKVCILLYIISHSFAFTFDFIEMA